MVAKGNVGPQQVHQSDIKKIYATDLNFALHSLPLGPTGSLPISSDARKVLAPRIVSPYNYYSFNPRKRGTRDADHNNGKVYMLNF